MAELSLVVVAAPKGTGLDCERSERLAHDRPQGVNQDFAICALFPEGHPRGILTDMCPLGGTNGQPAEALAPTGCVRWARPQPKMAFAPLIVGQHLRLVLNPLRPTDRESDTPPDAGTARSEQSNCHFVLCLITHEIDQKLA